MKPSASSAPRGVLDTQVLLRGVAAVAESLTAKLYDAWRRGLVTLRLSHPMLAEIEDVLRRPAVREKLRLNPIEARALVALLRRRGQGHPLPGDPQEASRTASSNARLRDRPRNPA